jgi:hypothetical protein
MAVVRQPSLAKKLRAVNRRSVPVRPELFGDWQLGQDEDGSLFAFNLKSGVKTILARSSDG